MIAKKFNQYMKDFKGLVTNVFQAVPKEKLRQILELKVKARIFY